MTSARWGVSLALVCSLACEPPPPAASPPPAPPPPESPTPRLVGVPDPPAAHQKLYELVGRLLTDEYAPASLKRGSVGFDPERELARLREGFEKTSLDKRARQRLLYEVFRSPRDIHTGVSFGNVRAVWLGVHLMKTADGKYRVAWRDPLRTPGVTLGLGEVVEAIDGVPITEAVSAVMKGTLYKSTPSFEQAFAEWFLVMRGEDVWPTIPPAGSEVRLRLAKSGNKAAREVRLTWLDADATPPSERSPFWGKTRAGYLPDLGAVMWRAADDAPYPAAVFAAHRSTWGYVRFHSYALSGPDRARALDHWKRAVAAFKKHQVRGVVLDQLGNGGGNFLFAYTLFSRLTDQPLHVPVQHYLTQGGGQVVGFGDAAFFGAQRTELGKIGTDADAEAFLVKYPLFSGVDFMPRTLATAQTLGRYFASLGELARSGSPGLTEPRASVESEITPNPDGVRYTGPLVMLIDGLNISAAEYSAAALGDAGRARLIGVGTAGAGGDQREYSTPRVCDKSPPNPFQPCLSPEASAELAALDVRTVSHTVTVGRRVDQTGKPTGYIENHGVPPHREHRITTVDLTHKFRDFRAVIFEELMALERR